MKHGQNIKPVTLPMAQHSVFTPGVRLTISQEIDSVRAMIKACAANHSCAQRIGPPTGTSCVRCQELFEHLAFLVGLQETADAMTGALSRNTTTR